jgi:RNA polymerase sigma-70 factor, ECF subfamily
VGAAHGDHFGRAGPIPFTYTFPIPIPSVPRTRSPSRPFRAIILARQPLQPPRHHTVRLFTEEPMNETDCIRRARDGDADAIRDLYRRYAPRVHAVVRRLAGDDALAEDWAQEAWVRAFRALPGFRGEARFSTWLHRIAVNSALHGRRGRERRAGREVALTERTDRATRGDTVVLRISLQRALDALPEGMRQVVVLHDVEGYTHEEIGELLGIAPGTSKSQLFKARARLRSMLQSSRGDVAREEACRT